jgi:hypothetical protein
MTTSPSDLRISFPRFAWFAIPILDSSASLPHQYNSCLQIPPDAQHPTVTPYLSLALTGELSPTAGTLKAIPAGAQLVPCVY